jgi:colicin import membrane protein
MPRKLKTYVTSQGFYDLAVAAPSMKAALEAWGASSNLFHQGFAKETRDSKIIAATMAKPGVILQRPVGTSEPFHEHAHLPTIRSLLAPSAAGRTSRRKEKPPKAHPVSEKAARKAALAFEGEQQRREAQRRKEEAAAAKVRARREAAMSKAEAALEHAKAEHAAIAARIEKDRAAAQKRAEAEERRWDKARGRLEAALRKARH